MADSDQVKAALAALADGEDNEQAGITSTRGARSGDGKTSRESETADGTDYRTVIKRAARATEDVDAAVAFVETVGIERLETAVTRAEREVSGLAEEGRTALRAFQQYRAAAETDSQSEA